MPVWKMQCAWALDSLFPRDKVIITPHFNDEGVGSDPQGLAEDLAAALHTWDASTAQLEVTVYDAQGTVPVAPVGYAIQAAGVSPATTAPREIACCLSFYSGFNRPRSRGRLYLPFHFLGASSSIANRPSAAHRTKAGQLATVFQDLGGVDVDWCVYSKTDHAPKPVTNWWVDDEWDTVRSRGLRSTVRTSGTTSEA